MKFFVAIALKTLPMWSAAILSFFFFLFLAVYAFLLCHSISYQSCILQFKMREPQMCNVVCRMVLNAKTAKAFKEKIRDEYRVNM